MAPKALTERDANSAMADNTNEPKRKRTETVDLTGDSSTDEDAPAQKTQKTASRINTDRRKPQPQPTQSAATYQTPPASSAQPPPSSSAAGGSQRAFQRYPSSTSLGRGQHPESERDAWLVGDDEAVDVDEIVSSTQDAAENDQLHKYGDLPTKIVGVQYYRGMANPGEYILMRREPGNPYDSNAIRIDNVAGTQIGHIPKRIAEKLAEYMDRGWLFCEGRLAGVVGQYDCPLEVDLYGPDPHSEAGRQLAGKMAADKLPTKALKEAERREKERQKQAEQERKRREQEEKQRLAEARRAAAGAGKGGVIPSSQNPQWASQGQGQPGMSSQPVMDDLLEASQRFNPREIGQATDQYGMQEDALKNMPLATKPQSIKTEMLPYQLQALKWLLDQENPQPPQPGSKEAVQLWKRHDRQNNAFTNIATNHSVSEAPVFASGGILADDMGLGKTLEMISLLVADAEKHGRGTTLVVAPLSVMSNWSGQIAHHVHEDKALKVYTYHAGGRVAMKAGDFAQYDVVITTYQTLASDYMPRGKGAASSKQPERKLRASGLYSMDWRRIILDEGHIIRNPASKGAAAVTAVMARSRWVLTGTPIVNSLKDLYSVLRFIGITGGLDTLQVFNTVLIRPLKNGDPSATFLLQAIMTAFTLRRRKEMAYIDLRLPKLDEYVHRIDFTAKEKERYVVLAKEAHGVLTKQQKKGTAQGFAHLLELLLRMRQCCNHWQLCGERVTKLMASLEENGAVDLTPETIKGLQDMLQLPIQSQEDCAVCLETLHNPVITTCGHAFGKECIAKVIETQHKCPMCRRELPDIESTCVGPANEHGDEAADDEMDLTQSSSKLEGMMTILAATRASGKGEKTVIFSQWTRFLDIVQSRLDREGYTYCRLDGTMSATKRDAALTSLEQNDKCTIMLASIGVCAVGLNLTAANQIILSDSWWAPAIEDQAVDRVHRLGQKKETRVFRLVVEQSIEDQVLEVQADKRKLMQLAFSEPGAKREKVKQGRLADIERLLAGQGV